MADRQYNGIAVNDEQCGAKGCCVLFYTVEKYVGLVYNALLARKTSEDEMNAYCNKTFTQITKEREIIADCEFTDCVFEKCRFTDCSFVNCTFCECKFFECSFVNPKTEEVSMLFAAFIKCTLVSVHWKVLQKGSVSFPIQKLDKCYLKYNDFENMNFKKFDFLQSNIIDSVFVNCNLTESNFANCDLKNTEFTECDLRKSDFRKASGYNIDLTRNRIKGAKFSYPEAMNLLNSLEIIIEK